MSEASRAEPNIGLWTMHVVSKLGGWLLHPANLGLVLLLAGTTLLWGRFHRIGRAIITMVAVMAVLVSSLPLADWLVRPLEDRFPAIVDHPAQVDGIVILGGAINQFITSGRGQPALNSSAERLTEGVSLARRYPNARFIFSGGSGKVFNQTLKEAGAALQFLKAMGLDPRRIELEDQSRNTHENALLARKMAEPRPGQTWLLVTSAIHMPRAVGAFRATGWAVTPYPVDYLTGAVGLTSLGSGLLPGLGMLAAAIREWSALAIYRVLGRSKALFPHP